MPDYPSNVVPPDMVQPVPRRLRAVLGSHTVFDTTRALYVWEVPYYPQYYIPFPDVDADCLVPEGQTQASARGPVEIHGLRIGDIYRPRAAKVLRKSPVEGLSDTVRFDWNSLDSWLEEDEPVFVHARNPYIRVDALRSTRSVRVELGGVVLAESTSPVLVFETGLPTRYYLNRTDINFEHLVRSDTVTSCPYKGTTSGYWSAMINGELHQDVAWVYNFPTIPLSPIAGMIAFYHEKVELYVDGRRVS